MRSFLSGRKAAKAGKKLTDKQINAITSSPKYAYEYAREILKKRFPAGEAAIAKDAEYAYRYTRYVLDLPEKEARAWGKK